MPVCPIDAPTPEAKVPLADIAKVALPHLLNTVKSNDEEICFAAISSMQSMFPAHGAQP